MPQKAHLLIVDDEAKLWLRSRERFGWPVTRQRSATTPRRPSNWPALRLSI